MASVIQPTMRASKRHKQIEREREREEREREREMRREKQQLKTRCQTKNMRI